MPRISLQNQPRAFRAAFLFVVFAGLLFSCGEGIRLFPFPSAEIAQNISSSLKESKESGYQKNILRSGDKQENYSSKSRGADFQKHWGHYLTALNKLRFTDSAGSRNIYLSFNYQAFKSRFLSNTCGSRAPPIS